VVGLENPIVNHRKTEKTLNRQANACRLRSANQGNSSAT
jgi:hypothetical protein